jgi:hypothetical protein
MKFNRNKKEEPKSELKKVVSSTIEAYGGWNEKNQKLIVEFKGGSQYLYNKIPVQTFDGLEKAESKGKFFHANIKGKFEFVKIKRGEKKEKKPEIVKDGE